MFKTTIQLCIVSLVLISTSGCETIKLTPQGGAVRPVTASEKASFCRFINIVEGFGAPLSGGMTKAMTDARNDVGALGGNGMYIISTRSEPYSQGCCYSYATVEALQCDFPDTRK